MRLIRPNVCVEDIFHVDYGSLWRRGFRLLVFDVDHTLLPYNSSKLSRKTRKKLQELRKMGFKIAFLTNTVFQWREKRAREIVDSAKMPVILICCNFFGCKPSPWGFNEVCRIVGISAARSVMIGDMLLRDIFGALKANYGFTVLVKPHGPDNIFILRCRRQERKMKAKLAEMGIHFS